MAKRFLSNVNVNDSYTLPSADGTSGQVIQTDGSGNLSFVDFASDEARKIIFTVKNKDSISLSKGTVVHASPSATPPSGNVIEVIRADNDDSTKMPAIGVLNETLAVDAEGECVMLGSVSGIATNSFNIGDELYVSDTPGEFTNTKPTGTSNLIQKIAIVIKSHSTNGLIEVFGAGRSNDVPNLVDRTITFSANQKFTDNSLILLGGGDMFQIGHKATFSQIATYEGHLYIDNNATDQDIIFRSDDGSGGLATYFALDGGITRTVVYKNFNFQDGVKLEMGTGADLKIYHDGTDSAIENITGDLYIQNYADDKDIIFQSDNGSGGTTAYMSLDGSATRVNFFVDTRHSDNVKALFGGGSDLQIYHDATNSIVTNTNGDLRFIQNADDKDIVFYCDQSGSAVPYLNLDGSEEKIVFFKEAFFGNNVKATFGANSDLQIYHDGSNSYIKDAGTGNLWIQGSAQVNIGGANGEIGIQYVENADVTLRHNNVAKLSTTSTGVKTTGEIVVDGTTGAFANSGITLKRTGVLTGDADILLAGTSGSEALAFRINDSEKVRIDSSGNLLVSKTSANNATVGNQFMTDGSANPTVDGDTVARFNRLTSDGEIIRLQKDTSTVGSIGSTTSYLNSSLGIGTTSPSYKLDVEHNSNATNGIQITNTNSGTSSRATVEFVSEDAQLNIYTTSSNYNGVASWADAGVLSTSSATSNGLIFNAQSGGIKFQISTAEKMRIDSSGNVGIGKTPSTWKLDVDSSDIYAASFDTSNNVGIVINGNNTTAAQIIGYSNSASTYNELHLRTNSTTTDGLYINSSGNVGIGTTSPSAKLTINTGTGTDSLRFEKDSQETYRIIHGTSGLYFTHPDSTALLFGLTQNGDITIHNNQSSQYVIFDNGTNSVGIGTTSPTEALDVNGNIKHTGLTMTSGTDVDQISTFDMTFQLTADTWTDTGIDGTDLATGTYAIQVFVDDNGAGGNHYTEYYSGIMSWYSGSTNSTVVDEIPLHRAGHAPNDGNIMLRTQRASGTDTHDLMLQIKYDRSHTLAMNGTDNRTITFKFRRLI